MSTKPTDSFGTACCVVCEPQFKDETHAHFNASLLAAVLHCFPRGQVAFLGVPRHIERVKASLAVDESRVIWLRAKSLASLKRQGRLPRLRSEWEVYGFAFAQARQLRAGAIVFCSMTNPGIWWLKLRHLGRPQLSVLAVLHQVQDLFGTSQRPETANYARLVRGMLRLPQSRRLRFVVLGPSILTALAERAPRLARNCAAIDLPCLDNYTASHEAGPSTCEPSSVCFGHFGAGREEKGFRLFLDLASRMGQEQAQARFSCVGYAKHLVGRDALWVDVPATPLERSCYEERARAVDYAVWVGDPDAYTLRASASFLDAVTYGKPCICLRNPFIAHYFQQFGDIGYLCDGYEELVEVVRGITKSFPINRYRQQCHNLQQARLVFTPSNVAEELKRLGLVERFVDEKQI